jgi:DNA-binding GntR family transcriptional regulator
MALQIPRPRRRAKPPALIADTAYVELRDRIVTLRLPPGASLREDELMRDLRLGRTPLREAIKRLSLEALVEVRPRRGTYVTAVHAADIVHIAEVRAELEPQAARLAAERMDDDDRARAVALAAEIAAAEGLDHEAAMRLDERVHRLLWETARNPHLTDTLDRLWALSLRVWYMVLERLPGLDAAVHDQGALLDAVIAGDGERAAALMREHVQGFEEHLLDLFAE